MSQPCNIQHQNGAQRTLVHDPVALQYASGECTRMMAPARSFPACRSVFVCISLSLALLLIRIDHAETCPVRVQCRGERANDSGPPEPCFGDESLGSTCRLAKKQTAEKKCKCFPFGGGRAREVAQTMTTHRILFPPICNQGNQNKRPGLL